MYIYVQLLRGLIGDKSGHLKFSQSSLWISKDSGGLKLENEIHFSEYFGKVG